VSLRYCIEDRVNRNSARYAIALIDVSLILYQQLIVSSSPALTLINNGESPLYLGIWICVERSSFSIEALFVFAIARVEHSGARHIHPWHLCR